MNGSYAAFLATLATVFLASAAARASCATLAGFPLPNDPNTVDVLFNGINVPCGLGVTLLRQDESTGAVYSVANCASSQIFQDECVPKGTYRYGLAVPLSCTEFATEATACFDTLPSFAEVTVVSDPPVGCMLSANDPGDTSSSEAAPWMPDDGGVPKETESCPVADAGVSGPTDPGGAICSARIASQRPMNTFAFGLGLIATVAAIRARRRK